MSKVAFTADGGTKIRVQEDRGNGTIAVEEFLPGDVGYEIAAALAIASPPPLAASTTPSPAQMLASVKIDAQRHVVKFSEEVRGHFVTKLPGQDMIYREKEVEAQRLLGDPTIPDSEVPFLAVEVGITAPSIQAVAQVIMATAAAWRLVGAQLEAARLGAGKAIKEATTPEAVQAAIPTFDAAIAAITAEGVN